MEVHVGVLDGRTLGAIEVVPKSGVYDYASKYTPGATDYICPPRLGTTRARGVMNLAERAARSLGCTGACRVDLLVTEGENEYVLEVNTLPGMTPTSLLPKIAASAGIDYGTLCEAILSGAALHSHIPATLILTRDGTRRRQGRCEDGDEERGAREDQTRHHHQPGELVVDHTGHSPEPMASHGGVERPMRARRSRATVEAAAFTTTRTTRITAARTVQPPREPWPTAG